LRACLLSLAVAALLALAACGREPSPEPTATGDGTATGEPEEPIAPPRAKESIEDAAERLTRALESGNCKEILEFDLSSRPSADEKARCEGLTTLLGGRKVLGSEEFKAGGVVDFEYGELGASAVLVVERDGRYHLAYVDTLLEGESAGTPAADEFDRAAADAFAALRDGDCDAFIQVANPRHGPGAAEKSAICDYVKASPVPGLAKSFPELKPMRLGANADYALYALATPDGFWTMVLGRAEDPQMLSESYEPLPADAPEFGFVDLIPTVP
ncbi:MAG: hypothetical protein M3Y34_01145, partial [Actinomycetota bacterium]|nr:hypothetical protein [Actinomycetota bacterium]